MIGPPLVASSLIGQRRRGGGGRSKRGRQGDHHPEADGEVSAKGGMQSFVWAVTELPPYVFLVFT